MNRAILVFLLCGCATVNTTMMDAHSASLKTQAAADLSCSKEQIQVATSSDDRWTADGCGKHKAYKLRNPNCVVERDCIWDPEP